MPFGNVFCNITCANHQKQWITAWYYHTSIALVARFFKVLVSCYSWEVMRGKMLQRDTGVHGGILEPVHYMHYIFFLQAHLNRIYQVWNPRGTEMYGSSVAKYASRFDKTPNWNQIIPFLLKISQLFLENPKEWSHQKFIKLIRLLHASQI